MKAKIISLIFLISPLINFSQVKPATPNEVVELIKQHLSCNWIEKTVDTYKAGDPNIPLNGIATCMFADMDVLRTAVRNKCNFIIAHEPVFYNHLDETSSLENDPVFREKMKFIKKNNLVIFRFHDHIHKTEPDGISIGMIEAMKLKEHSVNNSQTFFEIPGTSISDFSKKLKEIFGLDNIRIIGNPDMKFSKLAFMAGAPGGQRHIQMLRNPDVEVLIAGEAQEWETYLYANDAIEQGKNKAVIFLGHIKSEEAGMKYCAEWLRTFIHEVNIKFIENKPNFTVL